MKNFQERKKLEQTIFSFPVMGIILFFVVLAILGTINVLRTKSSLDREITRLKDEIAKTDKSRQDYETQMSSLQTTEGIDREARSRFNLKKPGEEVVLFVDDAKKETPPPESEVAGAYHAIQKWFKNIFSW